MCGYKPVLVDASTLALKQLNLPVCYEELVFFSTTRTTKSAGNMQLADRRVLSDQARVISLLCSRMVEESRVRFD